MGEKIFSGLMLLGRSKHKPAGTRASVRVLSLAW
jgi:hypothetical protein